MRWVVLLQGINDITASEQLPEPKDKVSAQQIIVGMQAFIARAHAKGLKIWGGTLLAREGATGSIPHTPIAEAKRQAVNAWIRTSNSFDAIIDFDKALRDPAQPERVLPAFASEDRTHPNDAGYKAMAEAIDL